MGTGDLQSHAYVHLYKYVRTGDLDKVISTSEEHYLQLLNEFFKTLVLKSEENNFYMLS